MEIKTWTDAEKLILRKFYRSYQAEGIRRQFLPHRSAGAITTKARRLGLEKRVLRFVHSATQYNPIRIPEEAHADLTGYLMGDPTPSRSALYRRGPQ